MGVTTTHCTGNPSVTVSQAHNLRCVLSQHLARYDEVGWQPKSLGGFPPTGYACGASGRGSVTCRSGNELGKVELS